MRALRIRLTQTSANYKKEETVTNKMTYPLPPFSTVIGALHSACGYTTYHEMDISIQGKYGSMHMEPYTDYCFLNRTEDDRGILVKMRNETCLSTAFKKVAISKTQNSSFRKRIKIAVMDEVLLQEYIDLRNLSEQIKTFKTERYDKVLNSIKKRKKELVNKKKKNKDDFKLVESIVKREKEIENLEKDIETRFSEYKTNEYKRPYSRFANVITSLKYYEVLNDIELVIHIKSDEKTLNDIKENIYNLKSIGRSEDFVDVKDVCIVELNKNIEAEITSEYSAYIDYNLIKEGYVNLRLSDSIEASGTKYYLSKNYKIIDGKRIFEKKKVIYASEYYADKTADNVYYDISSDVQYLVTFN